MEKHYLEWLDRLVDNINDYERIRTLNGDVRAFSRGSDRSIHIAGGLEMVANTCGFEISATAHFNGIFDKISFMYRGYEFFELIEREAGLENGEV